MEGAAVKELAERFRQPVKIDDNIVAPKDWQLWTPRDLIKPGPEVDGFTVSSLSAVSDYLATNRDALKLETVVVHVEGPTRVTIQSALLGAARDRELYVTAVATDLTDGFLNGFQSIESFIIGLQVRFRDEAQRGDLLRTVSSVKTEQTRSAEDDGVSQTLEARGAALRAAVPLPNPVMLSPYRTFREIEQPISPFVLRATAQEGKLPQLGLFEADGGTWKLETVERIARWLRTNLPADVAVLA